MPNDTVRPRCPKRCSRYVATEASHPSRISRPLRHQHAVAATGRPHQVDIDGVIESAHGRPDVVRDALDRRPQIPIGPDAGALTFLGDKLGVELYFAAIVAFGVRIFDNLAVIRRHLL